MKSFCRTQRRTSAAVVARSSSSTLERGPGANAVNAGAHAGKILGTISAIAGGKGGGRPDSAMSGGRDLDKVDDALAAVESLL